MFIIARTHCEQCHIYLPMNQRYQSYDKATKQRRWMCFPCYQAIREHRQKAKLIAIAKNNYITAHRYRAKRLGLPATLTQEEWNQTKSYFKQKCAYCQSAPIECLEHFVPLELGLGTTWYNCVPSCHKCNRKKNGSHPALVTLIPQKDIERVCNYLLSRLNLP